MTWGRTQRGVSVASLQDPSKKARQIQASADMFVAILEDKSVATWGHSSATGAKHAAQHLLDKRAADPS